jgi:pimeloyl-ACP methyl ester carboxylesterase
MSAKLKEQAALLGARKSLASIIAQPASAASAGERAGVVILNAGIIHRVGPHRMFVGLSRQLAAAGHTVVRFDLSGIGDSPPREDGLAPLDASLADIREVLDELETTRGIRRVVLIGLCWGADLSIICAASDPRVCGVVLIDPAVPRTPRYYVHHYCNRVFRLRSWLNVLRGRHPLWDRLKRFSGVAAEAPPDYEPPNLQSPQVRAFLADVYTRAVSAGVGMLVVCTGDLDSDYNYRRQLLDAFPRVPFGPQLQLEFFANTDHTFTSERDRDALMRLIVPWVTGGAHTASRAREAKEALG